MCDLYMEVTISTTEHMINFNSSVKIIIFSHFLGKYVLLK